MLKIVYDIFDGLYVLKKLSISWLMPKKDINVGKSQNLIILKIFKNCEHDNMSKNC